jgi:hypothetical protein
MEAVACRYQLRRDSNPVTRFPYAAIKNMIDAEPFAYFAELERPFL